MRKTLALLALLLLAAGTASAQTLQWQGANTNVCTDLGQIDIDDPLLWKDTATEANRLPTAADEVIFDYSGRYWRRDDLAIGTGSSFQARKLTFTAIPWGYLNRSPLYLQKSLTMEEVYLQFGYNSGGEGNYNLRIGSADTNAELLLRQADQDAITGGSVTIEGALGNAVISLDGLSSDPAVRRGEIIGRINDATESTGVQAAGTGDITLSTTGIGSDQFVKVTQGGTTFRTTGVYADQPLNNVRGLGFVESTLTLSGATPIDLASTVASNNNYTSWRTIRIYPGSALVLSNSNITLIQQHQSATDYYLRIGPIDGTDGSVEFTAANGNITLENPGIRSDGVLNIGLHTLKVRSDQTFSNPTGLGFIRLGASTAGHTMVETIDSGDVDLTNAPLVIDTNINDNSSGAFSAGSYESWHIRGSNGASRRYSYYDLLGDVELTGYAIETVPDDLAKAAYETLNSAFALILSAGSGHRCV